MKWISQWHSLSREEQSIYYEKARQERQLHMELYPGWSARDNYGYGSKKKKRKKDRSPADTGGITHCFVLFIPSLLFSLTKPKKRNDRTFSLFPLGALSKKEIWKSFRGFFSFVYWLLLHFEFEQIFGEKWWKNFSSWMHLRWAFQSSKRFGKLEKL